MFTALRCVFYRLALREDTHHGSGISGTTQLTCNGVKTGTLTAVPTAGGKVPYTYLWSNGKKTATITSIGAGTYTVSVKEAENVIATATHIITQPEKVTATFVVTKPSCNGVADGSIVLIGKGGTPGYTYSKDGTNWQTEPLFENLIAGIYSIQIKDAND